MAFKRDKVIQSAEKLVGKGKLEAAIKQYRKVLVETPEDTNTLNKVGDLLVRLKRIDEAIGLFAKTASQYEEDGFYVRSIAIYKKILRLDPTRHQTFEPLANLYAKQGLVTDARAQYQVLADYYIKHEDSAAAINIYQKLVDLEPENPSHQLKLAELYRQMKLWDKALESYGAIAELMLTHGSVSDAVEFYKRAIREVESSDLVSFVERAADKLIAGGHRAEAQEVVEVAMEADPTSRSLLALLEGSPSTEAPAEPEPDESESSDVEAAFDIDMDDDAFVLDLDDETSTSLVMPPPDMTEPGTAFDLDDSAIELDVDLDDSAIELDIPDLDMPTLDADSAIELDLADEAPAADEFTFEIELEPPDLPTPDVSAVMEAPELEPEPEPEASTVVAPTEGDAESVESAAIAAEPAEVDFDEAIEAEPPPSIDDLLAEAEVFSKYGLTSKAQERIEQALALDPEHIDSLAALVGVFVEAGDENSARETAARLADVAKTAGRSEVWEAANERMIDAGMVSAVFEVEPVEPIELSPTPEVEPSIEAEPAMADEPASEEPPESVELAEVLQPTDRVEAFDPVEPIDVPELATLQAEEVEEVGLDELIGESVEPSVAPVVDDAKPVEAPARPVKRRKKKDRITALLDELTDEFQTTRRKKPPTVVAAPVPEPVEVEPPVEPVTFEPEVSELAEARTVEEPIAEPLEEAPEVTAEVVEEPEVVLAAPTGVPTMDEDLDAELPGIVFPEEQALDDSGMDWLREEPAQEPAAAAAEDKLFDDEDDFFDLAAELEQELDEADRGVAEEAVAQTEEPSLEEIVEGFKKGVAENLSQEDYDTHFNLGIAYREMGLLDEAIGEFQLAAKSPEHLVDCCSMLGVSFLEKGLPELAIKWYQRGLTAADLTEEVTSNLLYEMGNTYLAANDQASAYRTFVELYGINSAYGDVVEKLDELKQYAD